MFYTDRVYGRVEISDSVLLELIHSPELERLKGVEQAGYFKPYFPGTAHNRFEHSVGVMILLQKYGANLKEQIAGLIHDVSHSVFSHCIDYALKEGSEKEHDYQDNIFKDFVRHSSIPPILKKHGYDSEYILREENFPLKENDLPALCADRIDYALRETLTYGVGDRKLTDFFLDNLTAENNRWFFKDYASAQKFADNFFRLNKDYFSNWETGVMFKTVGEYLKYALENKYINHDDLYTTDALVLAKINKFLNQDARLNLLYERMNNRIKAVNNPADFDVRVYCKSRIVDPLCRHDGALEKVSEINPDWKEVLAQELKPKEYFIKFASSPNGKPAYR